MMQTFLVVAGGAFGVLIVLCALLTMLPRLGPDNRAMRWASRAPLLDVIVALLTWVPWVVGAVWWGWLGFAASVAGQFATLGVWVMAHELMHPAARKGPRIVTVLNGIVGRPRNHIALWATLIALPLFWAVRAGEVFVYPMLVFLLKFPRIRTGDWINVSRHKFAGLVGHDLIWCLYCDWMTGVYSLGGEMLRHVESFWCPIRFSDKAKCDNCRIDFPDVDAAWVPADATMADVAVLLKKHYAAGKRDWMSKPAHLTVSAPRTHDQA